MRLLHIVYRGLIVCLALLAVVFIAGTIYGLLSSASPPVNTRETSSQKPGEGQTFTGIGRIRVSTTDSDPGMIILFISFIYYPEDKAFSEELALRVGEFRQISTDYLGSFTASELQAHDENELKMELLRRFNAVLRLGQIETLYFSDFMVVG